MKSYEALFIIDPDKESSVKDVITNITGEIAKNKGKINKEESTGKQRLAYPIKRKKEAIFYKLDFSIDPSAISALNASYGLNSDILRVMITSK